MTHTASGQGSTGKPGFVENHAAWTPEQQAAAEDLVGLLAAIDYVRVGFGDPHGILRTKVLSVNAFRTALRNGLDMSPGPLIFDTGHALPNDIFRPGAGLGLRELTGAGDFILVLDPLSFREVKTAGSRTAIILGDEYLRDGTPHPLSSRGALSRVVAEAAAAGVAPVLGLEVEWYLLRLLDPLDRGGVKGFGVQGRAPTVSPVNAGYQFNSDSLIEDLLPVLGPIGRALQDELGLPLRTIEHESGPGQIEFTFDPLAAMAAADGMLLARAMIKQRCLREGYLASFMSVPGFAGADPSGWHLHQSLADADGNNLFASDSDLLSDVGLSYLAGLLEHGAATTALAIPTINGYRRLDPVNTLSPDRLVWSHENRGAMIRVLGGPGDRTSHLENRIGEPAANPYLYMAGQIAAGLSGVEAGKAVPESSDPHAAGEPALPGALGAALGCLQESDLVRRTLGDPLTENFLALKASELRRYQQWLSGQPDQVPPGVSQWESDEYLTMF